ncbi:MAG: hypothetical protein WAO00_17440 [Chthoniobacterales bacterium]
MKSVAKPSFDQSVFINCPFDDEYRPLLRALIFTVLFVGKFPRIASERLDSGETRIEKIIQLVVESRFGIHDLSRCAARKEGELFRLNMPLELGIDLGCRLKGRKWKDKRCLILETKRYRYQATISDLSNSDIGSHGDKPLRLIECVSSWLEKEAGAKPNSPTSIWAAFNDFLAENYYQLKRLAYTDREIEKLDIIKLKSQMIEWLEERDRKTALPMPGRAGFVLSPFSLLSKPIDVGSSKRGAKVKCPYTGK